MLSSLQRRAEQNISSFSKEPHFFQQVVYWLSTWTRRLTAKKHNGYWSRLVSKQPSHMQLHTGLLTNTWPSTSHTFILPSCPVTFALQKDTRNPAYWVTSKSPQVVAMKRLKTPLTQAHLSGSWSLKMLPRNVTSTAVSQSNTSRHNRRKI